MDGELGTCTGVVFDFALSDRVTVFNSELMVIRGEYLQLRLGMCSVPVGQLDPLTPGSALVREMLTSDNWSWQGLA